MPRKLRHQVSVRATVYDRLKRYAQAQNLPVSSVVEAAVSGIPNPPTVPTMPEHASNCDKQTDSAFACNGGCEPAVEPK